MSCVVNLSKNNRRSTIDGYVVNLCFARLSAWLNNKYLKEKIKKISITIAALSNIG